MATETLITIAVGLLACLLAAQQLAIFRRQLQSFRWNQALKTMEMAEQWIGSNLLALRTYSRKYYDYETMSPVDLHKLRQDPEWPKISSSFMAILNYFDLVAIASMRKIIDEELAYTIFCYAFVDYLRIMRPFIEFTRGTTNRPHAPVKAWGCFEAVALRWEKALV